MHTSPAVLNWLVCLTISLASQDNSLPRLMLKSASDTEGLQSPGTRVGNREYPPKSLMNNEDVFPKPYSKPGRANDQRHPNVLSDGVAA